MWRRLASLTFAWWSLLVMALWMAIGVILGSNPEYYQAIRGMNDELLVHWIMGPGWYHPVLAVWFLGLVLAVGVMLFNMALCTFYKLIPFLKGRITGRFLFLLCIHLLMFLVLAGHASQMSLGHKKENLGLLPDQIHTLPDGLQLRLDEVRYTDDLEILRKPKTGRRAYRLSRDQFHRRLNLARISFLQDGKVVKQSVIKVMEPVECQGTMVSLFSFFMPKKEGAETVGVKLSVSSNPLTGFFFAAYAVLAVLYFLYSLTVWRKPANGKPREQEA